MSGLGTDAAPSQGSGAGTIPGVDEVLEPRSFHSSAREAFHVCIPLSAGFLCFLRLPHAVLVAGPVSYTHLTLPTTPYV